MIRNYGNATSNSVDSGLRRNDGLIVRLRRKLESGVSIHNYGNATSNPIDSRFRRNDGCGVRLHRKPQSPTPSINPHPVYPVHPCHYPTRHSNPPTVIPACAGIWRRDTQLRQRNQQPIDSSLCRNDGCGVGLHRKPQSPTLSINPHPVYPVYPCHYPTRHSSASRNPPSQSATTATQPAAHRLIPACAETTVAALDSSASRNRQPNQSIPIPFILYIHAITQPAIPIPQPSFQPPPSFRRKPESGVAIRDLR